MLQVCLCYRKGQLPFLESPGERDLLMSLQCLSSKKVKWGTRGDWKWWINKHILLHFLTFGTLLHLTRFRIFQYCQRNCLFAFVIKMCQCAVKSQVLTATGSKEEESKWSSQYHSFSKYLSCSLWYDLPRRNKSICGNSVTLHVFIKTKVL